jgi:hypothetical protein
VFIAGSKAIGKSFGKLTGGKQMEGKRADVKNFKKGRY